VRHPSQRLIGVGTPDSHFAFEGVAPQVVQQLDTDTCCAHCAQGKTGLNGCFSWNLFYLLRVRLFFSFLFLRIMKTSNIFLFIKLVPFFQRIADRARDGYFFYLSGSCSPARYPLLAQKFRRLYETNLSKDRRYRDRKKGKAVYSMLAYQLKSDQGSNISWILMRTEGEESLVSDKTESWKDIRIDRYVGFNRYELHRHTRKDMSKPSWSWKFKKELYKEIRETIINLIRSKSDKRLQEMIVAINAAPKFAPIRTQIKQLHELIRAEYARTRSATETLPSLPRVGFTRRVKDQTRQLKFKAD
jgi:hypothetical protein